jgi:hypothetical protein
MTKPISFDDIPQLPDGSERRIIVETIARIKKELAEGDGCCLHNDSTCKEVIL